jgi:exopolysaccharide production protein ExoZ
MVAITDDTSRPGDFLRDRFLRLVPLYWIATIVWLGWLGFAGWRFPSLERTIASFLFVPLSSLQAGVHGFPALAVGWTLNYEMLFYVLFAATLLLPRQMRIAALTVIFLGLVAVGLRSQPRNGTFSYWTNPIILEFLAGAWVATFLRLSDTPRRRAGWLLIAAMPPLLLAFQASLWALDFLPLNNYRGWQCIPMAALLAGAVLLDDRRSGPRLPWLAKLGDASYSLYLFHPIALGVTAWVLPRLSLPVWPSFVITLAAGLAAGIVAHILIERPLLRWLRKPRTHDGWPIPAGV